jgi:signal peptidase I
VTRPAVLDDAAAAAVAEDERMSPERDADAREAEAPADAETASAAVPRERGLLHYLGLSLSIALLLLVIGLAAVSIVIPKAAGAIPLTVLTNSMEPGMPPGTLAIVRPIDPDAVEMGDAITYQVRSGDPTVITHRVVGILGPDADGEREFILQGDNNANPDPDPVREVQVQGEVWYSIPLLGWVNSAMNGTDRGWYVGIGAGLLFAYAAWMVVLAVRDAGRKRRAKAAAASAEPSSTIHPEP